MKTSIKLGLVLGSLWLGSLLYLGLNIIPDEEETMLMFQRLDEVNVELQRLHRQNEELRQQATQQRNLLKQINKYQNTEGDGIQQLQTVLREANNELLKIIDNTDPNYHHMLAAQRQACGNEPTREHEILRRQIERGVTDMWYYVKAELNKLTEMKNIVEVKERVEEVLEDAGHRQRTLHVDLARLSAVDSQWKLLEAKELDQLVQKRFYYLQNPKDCNAAKKIVCNLQKPCGYGCQLHHIAYCFIVAYATERTLILESEGWRYSKNGWETLFLPLSSTCQVVSGNKSRWGPPDSIKNVQVVELPIIDSLHPRPEILPLAIPEDLHERLTRLHDNPIVWWLGQIIKYLTRPQPALADEMNKTEEMLGFLHPIVGVHVRRTDKVKRKEAAFHEIEEYMVHVDEYYKQYEMSVDPEEQVIRRVYLATDDPALLLEARMKFPEYTFVSSTNISQSAQMSSRFSEISLIGVVLDIHFLSLSDFLVCTFSSQVCRVAYETMQTYHPDAASFFYSLDDIFYYGGQNEHQQIALYAHEPRSSAEMELKPGDVVAVAGNHWDGWSKGVNHQLRTKQSRGLYPTYKVVDKVDVAKMPTYPEAENIPLPT